MRRRQNSDSNAQHHDWTAQGHNKITQILYHHWNGVELTIPSLLPRTRRTAKCSCPVLRKGWCGVPATTTNNAPTLRRLRPEMLLGV